MKVKEIWHTNDSFGWRIKGLKNEMKKLKAKKVKKNGVHANLIMRFDEKLSSRNCGIKL